MKKTVKIAALVLALFCILPLAISCADTGDSETTTAAVASTTAAVEDVTTSYNPVDHITVKDLDKYTFRMLIPSRTWAIVNMTSDEITGDVIQDAICSRQQAVETLLNCTLEETIITDNVTTQLMSKAAASGDDAYDLGLVQTYNAMNLYLQGYTVDQSTVESINLSNPWWESEFNSQVNIGSKRYITFSQANLIYYSSFYIFCFNKEMIGSYNLESPYDLVKSGEWTWDKCYEMMKTAATDTGNDGQCDPGTEDIMGITGHINHSRNLIFASGFTICSEDANGKLTYDGLSQNYIDAFTKFTEYFITSPYAAISGASSNKYTNYTGTTGIPNYVSVFVEGKSLFLTTGTNEVMGIRESEQEYGIVVVPKYSKDQESYNTPVYSATEGFVIPVSSGDVERTGVVLEALGAYSYNNLVDKHISIVLHYRAAQDATAIEMINQAYESGAIDVAMAHNFGSCTDMLNNLNVNGSTNITTLFGQIKNKMQKDIKNALDSLDN